MRGDAVGAGAALEALGLVATTADGGIGGTMLWPLSFTPSIGSGGGFGDSVLEGRSSRSVTGIGGAVV